MPSTIEHTAQQANGDLADELHELEAQESALERRTRSLELSGPLTLVFSFFALAVAIGALVVALGKDSPNTSVPASAGTTQPGMMGSSAATGMMSGPGGHGRFSASMMAAAAKGTLDVQLGEYWVAPAASSVRAGKVTFVATNVGQIPHELMVERMPIKLDSADHPNEEAAQGMIEDLDAGKTGQMTLHLRPGKYMLFCNITGHYAAGQHILLDVAKS